MSEHPNIPPITNAKKKSILTKFTLEQWVYILCGLGVLVYGLMIWVGSMTARNTNNQIQSLTVVSDMNDENKVAKDIVKRQLFEKVYSNTELPDGSKLTVEEKGKLLENLSEIPYGYDGLGFSMAIPKGWRISNAVGKWFVNKDDEGDVIRPNFPVSTVITKYYGPAEIDMIPFLTVEFEDLKYQVTADTLLSTHLNSFSLSPMAIKLDGNNHAEVMYIDIIDKGTYVVRKLFIIKDNTLAVLTIAVPMNVYNDYGHLMGAVVNSFRFDETPKINIEKTEHFSALGTIAIDYFPSWKLVNINDESSLSLSFQLHNVAIDTVSLNGLIDVKALRINKNISATDTLKAYHQTMSQEGIEIKDIIDTVKLTGLDDDYLYAVQETYNAELITKVDERYQGIIEESDRKRSQQIFKLTTINNGNYIVFVSLLGVPENVDALQYGRNLVQYDQVIKSLSIRRKR